MKLKTVNYERIDSDHWLYDLMQTIIGKHHSDLAEAKIGLFWKLGWNADADGRQTLGKCCKISEQTKEMLGEEADLDFAILLNKEVVNSPEWSREQTKALLDHELCHAAPAMDDKNEGEQKQDERGRLLWRIRKHDIEEFREIVHRHGCYKEDLEAFAETIRQNNQAPLLKAVGQ